MKDDLLKIIQHYGIIPQLKYFQSEVFELNEAIIKWENYEYVDFEYVQEDYEKHIAEEIADVMVMLKQFQYYYGIEDKDIAEIMRYKIERQLSRIAKDD